MSAWRSKDPDRGKRYGWRCATAGCLTVTLEWRKWRPTFCYRCGGEQFTERVEVLSRSEMLNAPRP